MMTTNTSDPRSLPPPLELRDGDLLVGWIDGDLVRFRGFGSRTAAAQAAAVAHQAMLRRLARGSRETPSANESDLAAVRRRSDHVDGEANGRAVASVLRSVIDGFRGPGSDEFAFEIRVPPPIDELRMRGIAYVMYRALRSSGVDWPLLRPAGALEEPPLLAAGAAAYANAPSEDGRTGAFGLRGFLDRVSRGWALPWPKPQRAS